MHEEDANARCELLLLRYGARLVFLSLTPRSGFRNGITRMDGVNQVTAVAYCALWK